jgi:hypothetical protein
MKRLILLCVSVLAIGACATQQPPPAAPAAAAPAAATSITPTNYAAGSPANTTTAFDGTWVGGPIRNMSKGETLRGADENPSCPNYNNAPNLTIAKGLAQLDFSILKFQGYVTPQGALVMSSGAGQRFEGQINSQNVLAGRVVGGCVYDASWKRA